MGILAFVSMIAGSARLGYRWIIYPLVAAGCLIPHLAHAALSPSNVLVLYNAGDANSSAIASYYSQKRPGVKLLGLTGVTTEEQVSADYYLSTIRPQILSALDDSTDVIVTTKGLPLRIKVDQANPGAYTDPFGVARSINSANWKKFSSLESELTRIDSVSTWQQMGDQTTGFTPSPISAKNPYYWKSADFSYEQYGIRLTSRLDAFTVNDVRGMIDRAGQAYATPSGPNSLFHIVIDDSPNAPGSSADNMERLRDYVLEPRGVPYTYDGTSAFIQAPDVSNPASALVMGYVSHGVHGGAPVNYLTDPVNGVQFQLANGAVFASWESYNATTFSPDVSVTQGLVAQWIARGGTAGVGHVAEPTASSTTVTREDALFDRLLSGMSWVESAWSATYQLSFVNTVVGDPLMRLQPWLPGDVTLDGAVDVQDFDRLRASWQQNGGFPNGDMTGDGFVNVPDLAIMQENWLRTATGGPCSGANSYIWMNPQTGIPEIRSIPEPCSWLLLLAGGVSLLVARRRWSGD